MQPFETKRLYFRPLTYADLDDLYSLYGDPTMMQYITGEPRPLAITKQRLMSHIADHETQGFGLCATILKENGAFIGRCGLEPKAGKYGIEGDIAWMFKQPYWGRGFATEFGVKMLQIAFDDLKLRRVYATADPDNPASIRVMHKLGFQFVHEDAEEVEYEIIQV